MAWPKVGMLGWGGRDELGMAGIVKGCRYHAVGLECIEKVMETPGGF